jgi:hypothetical protein
MLALAPRHQKRESDHHRMDREDLMTPHHPGGDHFTPIDRERLITTSVDLKNLREDFNDLKKSLYDGDNRFTSLVGTQGNRFEGLLSVQANRFESLLSGQGARFEQLVTGQYTKFETLVTKIDGKADRLAERIAKLENYKWWLMGAAAGSGTLAGIIGSRFFHP